MTRTSGTKYHLRPPGGWLNDPNGMVKHLGRWHVFYQHNPAAPVHGQICWGHASSDDLVHWRDHPIAFSPTDGGPDADGCWSGVFVPGLPRPAMVYSGVAGHSFTICLRWGSHDLDEWSEPIVVAATPTTDEIREMRDPFVFELGGTRWAIVGAGRNDGSPVVLLFECQDISNWTYRGVWLTADQAVLSEATPADIWECPQLASFGDSALLILSLHDNQKLTDVVGCVGKLSNREGVPRFDPERVDVLDEGTAFYAPQIANDDGAGWWLMGWVRGEADGLDHAGCLTLPRRLKGANQPLQLDRLTASGISLGAAETANDLVVADQQFVSVGGGGAKLSHPRYGEHELPDGTTLWCDASVLEVYRPAWRRSPTVLMKVGS